MSSTQGLAGEAKQRPAFAEAGKTGRRYADERKVPTSSAFEMKGPKLDSKGLTPMRTAEQAVLCEKRMLRAVLNAALLAQQCTDSTRQSPFEDPAPDLRSSGRCRASLTSIELRRGNAELLCSSIVASLPRVLAWVRAEIV